MNPEWEFLHPEMRIEHLGFLPHWLSTDNPWPAKDQIDRNYGHGGGWQSFTGFKLNKETLELSYPGDPAMKPLAKTKLRDETVIFYPHSWVGILNDNGSFDIARID